MNDKGESVIHFDFTAFDLIKGDELLKACKIGLENSTKENRSGRRRGSDPLTDLPPKVRRKPSKLRSNSPTAFVSTSTTFTRPPS